MSVHKLCSTTFKMRHNGRMHLLTTKHDDANTLVLFDNELIEKLIGQVQFNK